ncbi:cytochrome c oxidase subunit II [Hirschia litorea]|uniref:Cytochrome c oxidase subunit 2 n=1 Tax=Hirschia litorea TaxID=1199156 RepID=A0ABW2IJJ5_9PROT
MVLTKLRVEIGFGACEELRETRKAMRLHGLKLSAAMAGALLVGAGSALANEPTPMAIGPQPAASAVAEQVTFFHNYVMVIITIITVFVTLLLGWVILKFNAKANPTPAKFSHNTAIEVIWTIAPVLILFAIAIFSFPLLFTLDVEPTKQKLESGEYQEIAADDWVTIKTYGRQWYWSYMIDFENTDGETEVVEFDARMIAGEDIASTPGARRNLSTDNPLVLPQGKYIRMNLAASDVIHSWAMPAFRLKTDAVPGRLNQLWFKAEKVGTYYGQCSELCGRDHAFMPIEMRIVPQEQYDEWLRLAYDDIDAATAYINQVAPRPAQLVRVASAQ